MKEDENLEDLGINTYARIVEEEAPYSINNTPIIKEFQK